MADLPRGQRSSDTGRVCGTCGDAMPDAAPNRKFCSERCRKRQYDGTCVDCGARTNGYHGRAKAGTRCLPCSTAYMKANAKWTPETIAEAIREFARRYGHTPRASDWNPATARRMGHPERAQRWYDDGCWPSQATVQEICGGLRAAAAMAGFAPRGDGDRVPA